MTVYVDTSALLAILDADDLHHPQAAEGWRHLLRQDVSMLTSSYVLLESFALVQSRLGLNAVRTLDREILPIIEVVWIDSNLHQTAVTALLAASRRKLSLVDCVSFEVMRLRDLEECFAFDPHFEDQGFHPVSC